MKTCLIAASLLTVLSCNAQAEDFASLTIACPVAHLPSQVEVARVFDVHNFDKAYDLRERVVSFARRTCKDGVGRVQIVADPGQLPGGLRALVEKR